MSENEFGLSEPDRGEVANMIRSGGGKMVSSDDLKKRIGATRHVDRVTIIKKFRHEHHGEKPISLDFISQHFLSQDEEPYTRRLAFTDGMLLNTGHVETPHLIVIANTSKEKEITISFDDVQAIRVPAKSAVDIHPVKGVVIRLHAQGEVTGRMHVFGA